MLFTDIFSEYFCHPRLKTRVHNSENNFYSYMNRVLHYNNCVLFLADDFRL
jgi:hypothetical protein